MSSPAHWRRHAFLMRAKYSAGLISAYGIGAVELFVITVLLGRSSSTEAQSLVTARNAIVVTVLFLASLAFAAWSTTKFVVPALNWYSRGDVPTDQQRYDALAITPRQTMVHVAMWVVSGGVFFLFNLHSGGRNLALIALATIFGGAAMLCMGNLISEAILRPVVIASMRPDKPSRRRAPGVMQRLIITWALCTAIPVTAIIAIMIDRYLLWVIHSDTPIGGPILILGATAIGAGLRGTILVSKSVSKPVREVGLAMAEVGSGHTDVSVGVDDSSDIGRLQVGFNRMAAAVDERERLRDLFGRHVGHDVAERAIEQEEMLSGDLLTAAVLFIDLTGSTAIAATRPPDEVATLLNEFFRLVVKAVDEHRGFVNKFGGDAALAIFGAPLGIDDPAGAALSAARELRASLQELPSLDFGIGVSYGCVFAGNIGAEQRYEYTVIGDPVNEAARLSDRAKDRQGRILAAEDAVAKAADDEAALWKARGRTVLRGRTRRTVYAEPVG